MALLVISESIDPERFAGELRKLAPDMDIRVWPEAGEAKDIRYTLVWRQPAGILKTFPNMEAIFSIGAGVDHVLSDPDLPNVPLVRFVDPNLTMRMSEYVCLHVLAHQRRMLEYAELQRRRTWKELWPQPGANEIRVGMLGLGVLGQDAAYHLAWLGFDVAGWSRSQKSLEAIQCYHGTDELDAFLTRTDILVCLLPLTPETRGMLNAELFAGLAGDGPLPGPVLINAGRGGLQVEADILAALESGALWAASLDVFEEEPLAETSPLWDHPRVIVTPHNASISDDRAVCAYVLDQIERHENGKPLENAVDAGRGY
ncbi:MAG: glyoxylate/hydroxypyruvate reductase A [Hyphomicrobiales bacterium]|nr:glyoxylate/hydroxypyruvate reductase A [Hyphomicrobiales bacterium]